MRQWFSVVASVVAFVLSLLSFYFTWWKDDPRLTVVTFEFDPNAADWNVSDEPSFSSHAAVKMQFADPGNKAVAVLRVEWLILPAGQGAAATEQRCAQVDDPDAAASWQKGALEKGDDTWVTNNVDPIVLEPGKIVADTFVFPYEISWPKRNNVFDVETCWRFTVMDHLGRTSVRAFPAYAVAFKGDGDKPSWKDAVKTFRVL